MKKIRKPTAIEEVKTLLSQAKHLLHVNHDQNQQRVIFDTLQAIDEAASVLHKAWEVSERHKLSDEYMRKEFVSMFSYFGRIKRNISASARNKH